MPSRNTVVGTQALGWPASAPILVSGGGMEVDDIVTLGGGRPNVMVVPALVAFLANLCPEMLVTIPLGFILLAIP